MPLRPVHLLAVLCVGALAAPTAYASGFDVLGSHGGAPGISSGHVEIERCASTIELELAEVATATAGLPVWVVEGVRIVGPADLATICDGWSVTVAVGVDGAAVESATAVLVAGTALPTVALPSPIPSASVTGTSALLAPPNLSVPVGTP